MRTVTKQKKKSSHCGNNNSKSYKYNSQPRFRMIGFTANSQDIEVSKTLALSSEAGPVTLPICGVIYYTGNHFVSRFISQQERYGIMMGLQQSASVCGKDI